MYTRERRIILRKKENVYSTKFGKEPAEPAPPFT